MAKGYGRTNVGTKEKPIWVQEGSSPYDIANAKAAARETEIRGLLDQVVSTYAPGGSYMQGQEAMLERTKKQTLAQGTQGLISSGLYGSTMTAGLPGRFEEEIGVPTRARLEDIRTDAYTKALSGKAGFIESITESVPDFGMMAQLTAQGQMPQQSMGSWAMQGLPAMGSTFGSTRSTSQSDAELEAKNQAALKEQEKNRQALAQMGNVVPKGNTEADRDARKKAGYYLDASGNLKRV